MSWNLDSVQNQSSKLAIFTGANIELGFETAKRLASKGIEVIMACRNLEKAESEKAEIIAQNPEAKLSLMHLIMQYGKCSTHNSLISLSEQKRALG